MSSSSFNTISNNSHEQDNNEQDNNPNNPNSQDKKVLSQWEQQLTIEQLLTLGNCEDTYVHPIPWDDVLSMDAYLPITPVTVRKWLTNVVESMNEFFAIHMSGNNMFQIQVSRRAYNGGVQVLNLSHWRGRQIFNRRVSVQWLERGKRRTIHTNVLDFWLKSTNRKQIFAKPNLSEPALSYTRSNPVAAWLRDQISWNESCLRFRSLNVKDVIYESFLATVGEKTLWSNKLICEQIYDILPESRPRKGKRPRIKTRDAIFIPSREIVEERLHELESPLPECTMRF